MHFRDVIYLLRVKIGNTRIMWDICLDLITKKTGMTSMNAGFTKDVYCFCYVIYTCSIFLFWNGLNPQLLI